MGAQIVQRAGNVRGEQCLDLVGIPGEPGGQKVAVFGMGAVAAPAGSRWALT
jgi:hypothetical protein